MATPDAHRITNQVSDSRYDSDRALNVTTLSSASTQKASGG